MTKSLTYTPYDGSATPFTIGLNQLDFDNWFEPDDGLGFYLDEKHHLLSANREAVFLADNATDNAQEETLALMVEYLSGHHPAHYARLGNFMRMADRMVDLEDSSMPALMRAGLLVQDDLVLMRKKEESWHLAAGFIAFPSSWSLKEKFGQPMEGVHAQVPGFESGSRNSGLINRMFDKLPPDRLVTRLNWSIKGNGNLPQPVSKHVDNDPAIARKEMMTNFVRVERQTLRRLPETGDILFTIRIYADPFSAIADRPDAPALYSSMADQLEAMTVEQVDYKGLTSLRAPLCQFLRGKALESA